MAWAGNGRSYYIPTMTASPLSPQPERPHIDMGCNAEIYTNAHFMELEMLAPLQTIEPGQTITHTEIWQLYGGLPVGHPAEAVVGKILREG